MPDKKVRAIDPLGVFAIANVIQAIDLNEFGPVPIGCPGNCGCNPMCGCESEPGCCENKCECEQKPGKLDILDMLSNPVFRNLVKGLDLNRIESISDFLTIVDEIRTKLPTPRLAAGPAGTK